MSDEIAQDNVVQANFPRVRATPPPATEATTRKVIFVKVNDETIPLSCHMQIGITDDTSELYFVTATPMADQEIVYLLERLKFELLSGHLDSQAEPE